MAAEELFAEKGFDCVSMNDVAERVNIQKSALYYYFKNKKDIHDTLIKDVYQKLRDRVREPVMSAEGQEERIRLLVTILVDFWSEHKRFPSIITREVLSGNELVHTELIPKVWLPMFTRLLGDIGNQDSEHGDNKDKIKADLPLLVINILAMSSFYFFVAPIFGAMTGDDYYAPDKIDKLKKEILNMVFNGIR